MMADSTFTKDELEKLYRTLLPTVRENMQKSEFELTPTVFLLLPGECIDMIVLANFGDKAQQRAVTAFVDSLCTEKQAEGLIFFSETWTLRRTVKNLDELRAVRAALPADLSQVPDRTEALMALLLTHGFHGGYITEITRNAAGRVTFGEEREMPPESKQEMFKYFPRWMT